MYFLIYTSTPSKKFSEAELKDLLVVAREKNERLSVTGMLVYLETMFIQLIEGEKEVILDLYNIIKQDRRHSQVMTLQEGPSDKHFFPDFTMGFHSASHQMQNVKGFEDLRDIVANSDSPSIKLLEIVDGL